MHVANLYTFQFIHDGTLRIAVELGFSTRKILYYYTFQKYLTGLRKSMMICYTHGRGEGKTLYFSGLLCSTVNCKNNFYSHDDVSSQSFAIFEVQYCSPPISPFLLGGMPMNRFGAYQKIHRYYWCYTIMDINIKILRDLACGRATDQ